MIKKINKKAELTSQQLITIIILIVSFAVILIFLFLLGFKAIIGESSCKTSLVWRAIPLGKYVLSVSCEPQNICVNLGGKCSVTGENIADEKIGKIEEINSIIEEYKKNCNSITGNGELKYGSEGECGICYILYFDDKINREPTAIISVYTGNAEKYTEIISINYNAIELKKLKEDKCNEFIF